MAEVVSWLNMLPVIKYMYGITGNSYSANQDHLTEIPYSYKIYML